ARDWPTRGAKRFNRRDQLEQQLQRAAREVERSRRAEAELSRPQDLKRAQVFEPLAPLAVPSYLEAYGYSARDAEAWLARPGSLAQPKLSLAVLGHEERDGHTLYLIACAVAEEGLPPLDWQVGKRLTSLREDLHDSVKEAFGENYARHFANTPFALKGGLPGTTARLSAWFASLAALANSGEAGPSVVALVLQFLEVPQAKERSSREDDTDDIEISIPEISIPVEDECQKLKTKPMPGSTIIHTVP
ncbi:unnamed protein product, partial [Polarella glacialis]